METLDEVINSAPTVILELLSSRCVYCTRMDAVIPDLSRLLRPDEIFYKIDVNDNPELAESLDIEGTPTFIVFRNGEEVWRWTGEIDGNALLSKIQSFE